MGLVKTLSEIKMSILDTFALGSKKRYRESERIVSENNRIVAVITGVKTCWWIKVNKKVVRLGPLDGATFPHMIYFTYYVDGVEYKGSYCVSYYLKCPNVNDKITVFYDKNDPTKYAVKLYSSGE